VPMREGMIDSFQHYPDPEGLYKPAVAELLAR
jgi:hypothetical protein